MIEGRLIFMDGRMRTVLMDRICEELFFVGDEVPEEPSWSRRIEIEYFLLGELKEKMSRNGFRRFVRKKDSFYEYLEVE